MKILSILAAVGFAAALTMGTAHADDHDKATPDNAAKANKATPKKGVKAAGKEVTLSGEMICGKCGLKETDKCQNVLKVADAGAETKYYLAENDASEKAHAKVCGGPSKATVKGTVSEAGGKKVLTASNVKYD